jgi:hypothetical protein
MSRGLTIFPGPKARVEFTGGEPVTADMVVFADGRRSIGRRLLDPSRPLRYAGYVAWRGQLADSLPELSDFTRYEPGSTQFNVFPILRKDGGVGVDWTFYLNMSSEQFTELLGADPTHRTFVLPGRAHPTEFLTPVVTLQAFAAWYQGDLDIAARTISEVLAMRPLYSAALLLKLALRLHTPPEELRVRMPTLAEIELIMGPPRPEWLRPLQQALADYLDPATPATG